MEQARRALYRGQCNCPYWHGLFGGLYLPHLRHAVYQRLVEAEALSDPIDVPRLEICDLDGDLMEEVALEASSTRAWVDPDCGGQLLVFDDTARRVCLGHVLTRRPETYHREMQMEPEQEGDGATDGPQSIHHVSRFDPELAARIVYDPYDRRILVDHFLRRDAGIHSIEGADYESLADLVRARYDINNSEVNDESAWVELRAQTGLSPVDGVLQIVKRIRLDADGTLEASYELVAEADRTVAGMFVVESAFALVPAPECEIALLDPVNGAKNSVCSPKDRGSWPRASRLQIHTGNDNVKLKMELEPAAEVWRFPIETVSQSEGGAELVYQGSVIAATWPCELQPGEVFRRRLTLRFEG